MLLLADALADWNQLSDEEFGAMDERGGLVSHSLVKATQWEYF